MNTFSGHKQKSATLVPPQPDFLYKTRHDIRGAMHVVIGMSKVLSTSDTLTPHQKEIVVTLKKNADHALELIDDMFDFLQPAAPGRESMPVKPHLPQTAEQSEGAHDWEKLMSASVSAELPGRKYHALLVEDSEASVLIAGFFLKNLGYSYTVAKSGSVALDKFFKGRYDVIIMDIQMPGMDGLETSRRIRALEKERDMSPTPILAITANATGDDQLFCMKAGMNDYLSKPFELNDLRKKLQNIMPANSL